VPLEEQADRRGVSDAFLLEDAFGQGIGRVARQDGHGTLQDDRAGVVFVVGEVDGAAARLLAGGQNGFVDVMAVEALTTELG